ncbi:DUF6894 family protein [Lichenibacterium dinghuense]|uniref:DUF6894 family protein n=1 Tax=Lichenibacterium dinghuense TaxID=2895977 RepID=UPI001F22B14E|nr:hypothetical protein [Lichenibacterium sp. 6Y81]
MMFFFDTHDGERRIVDGSGTDLAGEAEAVEQAVALLRDLSHAEVALGSPRLFSVTVRDAAGRGLYAASLELRVDSLA